MIEFIEECRREWKRLGVPDPIANEMAADLTADIEEAEAEGGSAEDVLGTSLFDPRRFAAAWAGARGVTAPSVESAPPAPPRRVSHQWYRPVLALALMAAAFLAVVAAAVLIVGRHSSAVAAPIGRVSILPGSTHLSGPGPVSPPLRIFMHGQSFVLGNAAPFAILAFAILLVGIAGLSFALLYWSPWFRRGSQRRLG